MPDNLIFRVGSIDNLPESNDPSIKPGQLLFAHDGLSGSIYLVDKNNSFVKFNADAKRLESNEIYINKTLFDGSASIVTDSWGQAREFTLGSTTKSVDGSSVTYEWSHEEIGATVSNYWTEGTEEGPTLTSVINGVKSTPVAIPSASEEHSGVINILTQYFSGDKYFKNNIIANNDEYSPYYSFKPLNANNILGNIGINGRTELGLDYFNDVYYSFRLHSYSAETNEILNDYEEFYLPAVDPDRTNNEKYEIFTAKNFTTLDNRYINVDGDVMTGILELEDSVVAYKGYTIRKTPEGVNNIIDALLVDDLDLTIGKIDFTYGEENNVWRFYQASKDDENNVLTIGRYYLLPSTPNNLTSDEYIGIITSEGGPIYKTLSLINFNRAAGNSYNEPALLIGGGPSLQHLEFDYNKILSKEDETTPGTLYLNSDGGDIIIGGSLRSMPVSEGESSLEIFYEEDKALSMYIDNLQQKRGIKDTNLGDIIKISEEDIFFYGNLIGNADTATYLTDSYGSISLPVFFNEGVPTTISHLWLNGFESLENTTNLIGLKSNLNNDNSYSTIGLGTIDSFHSALNWSTYYGSTSNEINRKLILDIDTIYPSETNVLDLGTSSFKWKNIYGSILHGSLDWNYLTSIPETFSPHLYISKAQGILNQNGYIKFAEIEIINSATADSPLVLEISRKNSNLSSTLYITFGSNYSLNSFKYTGENYGCYICKYSNTVWYLYCQKNNNDDELSVLRYHKPHAMSGVKVSWRDEQATTLPTDDIYEATPGGVLGSGRELTIGNSSKIFNGSDNISWSANEIGLMSLSQVGTQIPEGANLNDYVIPGNYYTINSYVTETIQNIPLIDTAMRLIVMTHFGENNTNYIKQFVLGATETIFIRVKAYHDDQISGEWGGWRALGLVEEAGILPIEGGGTGATTAKDALINLHGVSYTVIGDLNDLL